MSTASITLEKVGPANISRCGIGCLTDRKNPGFQHKADWLQDRFAEGLRLLLFRNDEGKPLGFLECVPGEHAWRPVDASGWLFVHCLWVYPRGQKIGGIGARLIEACLEEARMSGAIGVAAMVSDGPWMAGREIFLKQGFRVVGAADRFELVTCHLKSGPEPRFREPRAAGTRDHGLQVVYCDQCPLLSKSVHDISEVAAEFGLKMEVTKLASAREAQNAPSYYGVFSLLWHGRLLADHYVSKARFKNILRQTVLKKSSP